MPDRAGPGCPEAVVRPYPVWGCTPGVPGVRGWLLDARAKPLYNALADRDGFLSSVIDKHALETLMARHVHEEEDATDRIWRLLNLQLWGDLFLTGRRERWSEGIMPEQSSLDPVPVQV